MGMTLVFWACAPSLVQKTPNREMPESFNHSIDTTNVAEIDWRIYFDDPDLTALIDTALKNNQELNIVAQEIEITRNEVQARKGEYLPFVDVGAGVGIDKVGRYTRPGALEANTEIEPGKEFPEPLGDLQFGAVASWEVDIWKKLRNAKKAAYNRYLASIEGRNFLVTSLIAEIASSYYELLALDNQLEIVRQNIEIQRNALEIVRSQKEAARVTELAVRRFEAQVLGTRSLQFDIQQKIIETENRINFMVGRFPQTIQRGGDFNSLTPDTLQFGIPSQLLLNRPDIREAEQELMAANLDIAVARARFYPSVGISAGIGYQAYNPSHLLATPESLLYGLGADLISPLFNRKEIKAMYANAGAAQVQAVFEYEQRILNAFIEVANQLSNISNLQNTYDLKSSQVQTLDQSVEISATLFQSARADYYEVLLTQREALDSRFELIETRLEQMKARINVYRSLGGGWD